MPVAASSTARSPACGSPARRTALPGSDVQQLRQSPRHYALLGELNTRPRTTYLARVGPADPPPGA